VLVRVDHALLGVPGARLEEVRRAHSHWQALAQCEEFLASLRIEPVPVHDTAGAARLIAETGDREDAAIASVEAGGLAGLAVLAERIQTEKENLTKFSVIGTADPGLGPADKTSLVMAVLDQPGSLLGALKPFADRGINLHKIESRPLRGKPFEYLMYVDIMASGETDPVRDALDEVRDHTSLLRVLGTYASATDPG
jgi:prephenate dehydratase